GGKAEKGSEEVVKDAFTGRNASSGPKAAPDPGSSRGPNAPVTAVTQAKSLSAERVRPSRRSAAPSRTSPLGEGARAGTRTRISRCVTAVLSPVGLPGRLATDASRGA